MLNEEQVNDLTWRELDFMYEAREISGQLEWAHTREILAMIINTNSKKKMRGKDVIKLDKIDKQVKITKNDRKRIKEKIKNWGIHGS